MHDVSALFHTVNNKIDCIGIPAYYQKYTQR